jgi:hypothetical protein
MHPVTPGPYVIVALLVAGCTAPDSARQPSLEIAVAPLTLPGISRVCYDLRTTNAADGAGSTVWAEGTPGTDGPADTGSICSNQYGNGEGGAITFVGSCDASPLNPGDTGRINSVTLWVDSIYGTSGTPISETGNDGWQDPCPSGCVLNATCLENTDTRIEFNLTILRQANQGFFDIGVNFQDIFCSAKVDCKNGAEPLKLLFNPSTGLRDTTIVSAFACTAGPETGVDTVLYRDDLKVVCDGSVTKIDPHTGRGNAWPITSDDPAPADPVWQYAVYADDENLSCAGSSCNKRYWNVAFGLDASATNCVLTTAMTAHDGELEDYTSPSDTTYPYIEVELPLTGTSGLTCSQHPLNGGNGVTTRYTPVSTPRAFETRFDGLTFERRAGAPTSDPNAPCTADCGTDGLALLLSGDGLTGGNNNTIVDSSASAHSITRTGTPTPGTFSPFSKTPGSWAVFMPDRGSGFYTNSLMVNGTQTSANIGTDFTLEFWFNGSATSAQTVVVGKSNWNSDANDSWFSGVSSTGTFYFGLYYGTGSPLSVKSFNSVSRVDDGKWHHCAFVKQGTTYRVFIDGALEASEVFTPAINSGTSRNVTIGGITNNATGGDYGRTNNFVSNVRITNTPVYTAAFTPLSAPLTAIPGTILLTAMDGNFRDRGPNNYPITIQQGSPQVTAFSPFGNTENYSPAADGGSISFNGSSEYLTIPDSDAFHFTGDFTMESWVYLRGASPGGGTHAIASQWGGFIGGTSWSFAVNSQGRLVLATSIGGTDSNVTATTTKVLTNTWNHVAVTREGSTVRLFVNGILDATTGVRSGSLANASLSVRIGFANATDLAYLNGDLSGLRIVKGTALYTASFTPPTSAPAAIPGTSLLLNATDARVFDAAQFTSFRTEGNAQLSSTQSKFGGSSLYFDGTAGTQLISAGGTSRLHPQFMLDSADFTLEFWLYYTGVADGGYTYPFYLRSTSPSAAVLTAGFGDAGYGHKFFVNTGPASSLADALVTNATKSSLANRWVHVAVVRRSGITTIYLDGVNSASFNRYYSVGPAYIMLGMSSTGTFTGYLDDVRLTKGSARYQANFTPPTAPLSPL